VRLDDRGVRRLGEEISCLGADDFRRRKARRSYKRHLRYLEHERPEQQERRRAPAWVPPVALENFDIFVKAWGGRRRDRAQSIPPVSKRAVCQNCGITLGQLETIVWKQVQWDVLLESDSAPEWRWANEWLRRYKRPVTPSLKGECREPNVTGRPESWWRMLGQLPSKRAPKHPACKTPPGLARRICDIAKQERRTSCRQIVDLLSQQNITVSSATVNRVLRRPNTYYLAESEFDLDDRLIHCLKMANERFKRGWGTRRLTRA